MESHDAVVARIARRQQAVLPHKQALDAGLSSGAVERRRNRGRWVALSRGVYVIGGAPVTWRTKVMAATLATGGIASHRTAAALLGIIGFPEAKVEITVPEGRRSDAIDAIQHERDDFRLIRPVLIDGIAVTPPERLVADLGMSVSYRRYEHAALRLVGRGALTWDDIVRSRFRYNRRGRDGSGALTELILRRADAEVPESVLEQALLFLLQEAGLDHHFEQQLEVHDGDRFVLRADFGIREARLLLECDSIEHHLFDPTAFERDRRKRNDAELLGWDVLAFTSKQIVRAPHLTLSTIERALRRAGRLPSPSPSSSLDLPAIVPACE